MRFLLVNRAPYIEPLITSFVVTLRKQSMATMAAWQVKQYGSIDDLSFTVKCRVPQLRHPNDVLVKVQAASVNPIDALMIGGYGSKTLNILRCFRNQCVPVTSELPLIPGRDFSGTIVEVGPSVQNYKPGDEVWGAGDASRQGTFAEYHIVSSCEISKKPSNLNHTNSASLPYVAATSWAALRTVGCLDENNTLGKRVLILAGGGGVGSFAIQLLKAWGAEVTAVCSTRAVSQVAKLGADIVIDYKTADVRTELEKIGGFDFIFDNLGYDISDYAAEFLKKDYRSRYVTIVVPFLRNNDEYGFVRGLSSSAFTLGTRFVTGLQKGHIYSWALFMPSGKAMKTVARLVEDGKIVPVVEQVMPFSDLPKALDIIKLKHSLGKIVIDMNLLVREK